MLIEQPDCSVVYALEYEEEGCKDRDATWLHSSRRGMNGSTSDRTSVTVSSMSAGSSASEEAAAQPPQGRQPHQQAAAEQL